MHESFKVEGCAGERVLQGEARVAGAKNAAIKAVAASLLFDGPVTIENAPHIEDMARVEEVVQHLGGSVARHERARIIDPRSIARSTLPRDIAKRMRASVVFTGPLLARFGSVSFPFPGGCVLGERPIDLFLEGFKAMGASVTETGEDFTLQVEGGALRGADIFFPVVSVTATETLLMAAVLARGTTTLSNVALEPEVTALAEFLRDSGADIEGIGTSTLRVRGRPLLAPMRSFITPPDRIEAGSFLILAALLGKDITITHCDPRHMGATLALLRRAGVSLEVGEGTIRVQCKNPASSLRGLSVRTHEYPGFPTDLQAPMTVFLTQVSGESSVLETIFDARFGYTEALVRMGASITVANPHRILIKGPRTLTAKELEGPDLRAGLAYLIAGACAKGTSLVKNAYVIDRGYEHIEERLRALGLSIERVRS